MPLDAIILPIQIEDTCLSVVFRLKFCQHLKEKKKRKEKFCQQFENENWSENFFGGKLVS
jgi:hypothetical protein